MVDRRFLGGKGQDEESVELDSQVGVKFSYYVRWTDRALRLRISPKSGVHSKFRSRFNCRVGCGVAGGPQYPLCTCQILSILDVDLKYAVGRGEV
jgi:hypothetical protein